MKTTIIAALLATTVGAVSAPALALERWVHVINEGSASIYEVHMTHKRDRGWGPDLLGQYVIPAGNYMTVEPARPNGYCKFDVKIVYETGREVMLWNVNLCELTAITASDSGYTSISY